MLKRHLSRGLSASAIAAVLAAGPPARAQDILKELEQADQTQPRHSGHGDGGAHDHGAAHSGGSTSPAAGHGGHKGKASSAPGAHRNKASHAGHDDMQHDAGADMPGGMHGGMHGMRAYLGPYPAGREGSGTSWLPDTTPHNGVHASYGEWQTMYHALFNLVYDHQGGRRGSDKTFVNGMFMAMAQRPLGDAGMFGVRAMLSPDPFMGPRGYPLLLATGETADGRTHLVDRQHPHDLFMELAATYSYQFDKKSSVFIYVGLPGEPALGPSAFMHRTSGIDIPEAPITHHWLDSTHITFGVVTAGVVLDQLKLEASTFKGREPDQHRYDIEAPKLDSYSARATWNPTAELSMQVSWGHLTSPEALEPDEDENRLTASISYTKKFGANNIWATTLAWGRKMAKPGNTLDGFIFETSAIFDKTYTVFARAERVEEDELLDLTPTPVFTVNKLTVGGIYDFYRKDNVTFGVGLLGSVYDLPGGLKAEYGSPSSGMIFARLKVE